MCDFSKLKVFLSRYMITTYNLLTMPTLNWNWGNQTCINLLFPIINYQNINKCIGEFIIQQTDIKNTD